MFSVATIFILAVTFSLLCYYFRNYIRTVRLAFKLRGPKAYPIIGHCYLINRSDELEKIGSDATQSGPIGKGWISFLPLIFIYHPRHLKIILGNNKLSRKNFFYTFLHNFVGEGLITNNDFKWKNNRKLIQPYFAINVLESFVSIFAENARETLEILDRYNENVDIKISSITNECVVNILHQAVLGISIKDKSTLESSPFRKGRTPFTFRIEKPWLLLETIFRYTSLAENESIQKRNLQNFAKNILKNRLEDMSNGIKGTNCLLNTLIEIAECNKEFTQEDIINEACTFMLAGQDSVGSATAFTLYYLAKHQDVQAKVYDEIKTACGDKKPNENIQIDHLNNMKYLEQCIKETLRLAPSIPIVTRSLTEDVKLDDYVVPRGTNLSIAIFATHRLAEHFPNPLKFDPDRFSPENVQNMHPYAFLPFSLGARNCIGYKFAYLEIKTVIATILEKYRVVLSPGKEKLNLTYKVTLRSKGGICVRLHKR